MRICFNSILAQIYECVEQMLNNNTSDNDIIEYVYNELGNIFCEDFNINVTFKNKCLTILVEHNGDVIIYSYCEYVKINDKYLIDEIKHHKYKIGEIL